jgi:AsmA family protein
MPKPTLRPRWLKLLLGGLAGIALLLGLLYFALNLLFPPQRLASLLAAQVSAATGRDFAVRGTLSIRVLPRIGVAAHDVVLGNAPWGSRKEMLRVKQASFDIAFWPLLQGLVDVASVSFSGVDLLLETDRHGVGNWVMAGPDTAVPPTGGDSGSPLRVHLSRIALTDTQLAYRDARSGTTHSLLLQTLELDVAGEGHTLDASFDSRGQQWQLQGQIGRLAELSANQADWPFDLQLSSDGALFAAKGLLRRGAMPHRLEADISARLTRVEALSPWLPNAARIPLPIELTGQLNYAPQSVRIDGLQLSVAQQQISGQLKALGGTPWQIDAQLASPSIDLARWLPPRAAAPAAPAAKDRRVFGTTPLGLEALPAGPATLSLHVDRLLMPGLPPLSNLKAQFNAQPGRFKADPVSFGLAGGTLRGSVTVASAAGSAPRVALQAQGSNLSMDELLQATGHSAFAKGGQVQLRADLNLAGGTPRALAASANGELMLSLANTTLGGGASPLGTSVLAKVLQAVSLQPTVPTSSRVRCAVLRLPLKNGVAAVDRSIAMETDQLSVSAKGEIRLDDETLTLAFRPSPKSGVKLNPVDLAKLVVLKGPWLDPKLALDAQGMVGLAASLGRAGATGGLSMLAQQLLKAAPEADVCRTAMGGAGTAPVPTVKPSPPPPQPAQGLPKGLPDALRQIFK